MQAGTLLITGSSRGIGAATAVLAASSGFDRICVNYKENMAAADSVVRAIEATGAQAVAVRGDVSREDDVVRMFDACDRLGPLKGLVNNAGILEHQARLDEMTPGRIRRIFETNVVGAFLCAKQAVRRMSTKYGGGGGAIVNVSSGASRLGSPGEYVDYAASKGALDTMTIGLAREVAEEGIRVNAVRAGFIYTDIHASGGEPKRVDRVKSLVPMQRGGTAEEVAKAILWLLSEDASYTTGAFIDVTGGK